MLWGGRKPSYIQQRGHAARLQDKRKKDEAYFTSIDRIANALESAQSQDQTDDDKRAFREKITIGLLIFTVLFTGGAAFEAHRLVNATNDAIAKADDASKVQHSDTVSAIAKADEANRDARKSAIDQVAAMQGQLEEMRNEQRPWVYQSVQIKGRIFREGDNFIIPLTWTLKNVGHLPAFGATILVDGFAKEFPFNSVSFPNAICDKRRIVPLDASGSGIIFPEQATEPQGHSPRISQAEYERLVKNGLALVAIGCVDYQIPGSDKHHQTRFGYVFGPSQLLGPGIFQADPTTVDISVMGANEGRFGSAD